MITQNSAPGASGTLVYDAGLVTRVILMAVRATT
jgi:hypothetical protein